MFRTDKPQSRKDFSGESLRHCIGWGIIFSPVVFERDQSSMVEENYLTNPFFRRSSREERQDMRILGCPIEGIWS